MRVTSLKGNGTQRKSNYQWMQMFSLEAEDECRGSCPRGPRPPQEQSGKAVGHQDSGVSLGQLGSHDLLSLPFDEDKASHSPFPWALSLLIRCIFSH